jgi:nicotinamidase-related amidase
MERIWDKYLPQRDRDILALAGYTQRMGFGDRPALIVIDVNYNFTGDKPEPVEESIKRWPNSCGEAAWKAFPYLNRLLRQCHRQAVPVFFATDGFRSDGWNLGSWLWKTSRVSEDLNGSLSKRNLNGSAINAELERIDSDITIQKLKPSAFNGTPLRQLLTLLKVDTLIVTGTTTSGCVRATVLDAFSDNMRVIVPEEACFDRIEVSHAINLFDMNAKYADVIPTREVVEYLEKIPAGTFQLPAGSP